MESDRDLVMRRNPRYLAGVRDIVVEIGLLKGRGKQLLLQGGTRGERFLFSFHNREAESGFVARIGVEDLGCRNFLILERLQFGVRRNLEERSSIRALLRQVCLWYNRLWTLMALMEECKNRSRITAAVLASIFGGPACFLTGSFKRRKDTRITCAK